MNKYLKRAKDYYAVKKWKEEMTQLIKLRYGDDIDKQFIEDFLNKQLEQHFKPEQLKLINNYEGIEKYSDTADIAEFLHRNKDICSTEHGVMFDNRKPNPASQMNMKFKKKRVFFKTRMKTFPPDSFEFEMDNLNQNNEKKKMNSWYGASGATTALFYNLHAALSTTGKGQTLISTAENAFEAFLANNVLFFRMDECLVFIKNVTSEKKDRTYDDAELISDPPTFEEVYDKIICTFKEKPKKKDRMMLFNILMNLDDEELNRLYFKNNLFEFFLRSKKARDILIRMTTIPGVVYSSPDLTKVPDEMKDDMDYLWSVVHEYVQYNYSYQNRRMRLKYELRKRIVVIDTDSNMVNVQPWVDFVEQTLLYNKYEKDKTELDLTLIYTLCFFMSKMIKLTLLKFLRACNVPEEKVNDIDMKNEYLFGRMLITDSKKNYASTIIYKEGKPMFNKLDIKGLMIMKSATNRIASAEFQQILENDILKCPEINLNLIIKKLIDFENKLDKSLKSGETTFLKPVKVKPVDAYDDPLKIAGVRGADIWNMTCNEEDKVSFEYGAETMFTAKLKGNTIESIEYLKKDYPSIYNTLMKNIFDNPEKRISSKGVYIIAIPSEEEKVPDWVIPLIDIPTIKADTMKAFLPILEALDLKPIYTSKTSHFSNIISI